MLNLRHNQNLKKQTTTAVITLNLLICTARPHTLLHFIRRQRYFTIFNYLFDYYYLRLQQSFERTPLCLNVPERVHRFLAVFAPVKRYKRYYDIALVQNVKVLLLHTVYIPGGQWVPTPALLRH